MLMSGRERERRECRERVSRTHVWLKTRENVNERPNAFRWKARER